MGKKCVFLSFPAIEKANRKSLCGPGKGSMKQRIYFRLLSIQKCLCNSYILQTNSSMLEIFRGFGPNALVRNNNIYN